MQIKSTKMKSVPKPHPKVELDASKHRFSQNSYTLPRITDGVDFRNFRDAGDTRFSNNRMFEYAAAGSLAGGAALILTSLTTDSLSTVLQTSNHFTGALIGALGVGGFAGFGIAHVVRKNRFHSEGAEALLQRGHRQEVQKCRERIEAYRKENPVFLEDLPQLDVIVGDPEVPERLKRLREGFSYLKDRTIVAVDDLERGTASPKDHKKLLEEFRTYERVTIESQPKYQAIQPWVGSLDNLVDSPYEYHTNEQKIRQFELSKSVAGQTSSLENLWASQHRTAPQMRDYLEKEIAHFESGGSIARPDSAYLSNPQTGQTYPLFDQLNDQFDSLFSAYAQPIFYSLYDADKFEAVKHSDSSISLRKRE